MITACLVLVKLATGKYLEKVEIIGIIVLLV